MNEALEKAIQAAGSKAKLARALGITIQAVSQWPRIPVKRIIAVEKITGVPREELCPELYRAPD